MNTLAHVACDLLAVPLPVLFLDTCALLDIVRATMGKPPMVVQVAVEVRTLTATGAMRLIVQDIVPNEWNDNLLAARREGEAGVRAFNETWQIAADLGKLTPPARVLPPKNLLADLEQLSRDLLAAATVLDRDPTGMSWALDRVVAKRKPSSPKGTVKDAYILGHALHLSALLGAGYPNSRIFVSSNQSDFAAGNSASFHPDIAPEAVAAGLRYAVSLEKAVADLRAAGDIP